jgi:amino acid transporter
MPFGIDGQDTMAKLLMIIMLMLITALGLFLLLTPELNPLMIEPDFEALLVISFIATFISMTFVFGFIWIVRRNATVGFLKG